MQSDDHFLGMENFLGGGFPAQERLWNSLNGEAGLAAAWFSATGFATAGFIAAGCLASGFLDAGFFFMT
jgi:hypothetical protein